MVDFITYTPPTHIDNLSHLTEQHGKNHIVFANKDASNSVFYEQLKAKYVQFIVDKNPIFRAITYSFNNWLLNGSYSFKSQLPYNNVYYMFTKQQSAALLQNTTLSVIDISLVQSYLDILARERFLTTSMSV